MKSKFLQVCMVIMVCCSITYFLFVDSLLAGIAFGVGFFTGVAFAIGLLVEEE